MVPSLDCARVRSRDLLRLSARACAAAGRRQTICGETRDGLGGKVIRRMVERFVGRQFGGDDGGPMSVANAASLAKAPRKEHEGDGMGAKRAHALRPASVGPGGDLRAVFQMPAPEAAPATAPGAS